MKRYRVELTSSAEKELYKLQPRVIANIVAALKSLEVEPRPSGCKKLKGYKNLWRQRVGDYRIIYAVEDVILLVDVREIGHRRYIYNEL